MDDSPDSMGEKPVEPYFVLDLSPVYPPLPFATSQDFRDWMMKERDFLQSLGAFSSFEPNSYPGTLIRDHLSLFQTLIQNQSNADRQPDKPSRDRELTANVREPIYERVARAKNLMLSFDPRAQFVKKLWDDGADKRKALFVYAAFGCVYSNPHSLEERDAIFVVLMYDHGLRGADVGVGAALASLQAEFQQRLTALDAAREALRKKAEDAASEWDLRAKSQIDEFSKAQEERTSAFKAALNQGEIQLNRITKAYDEQLSLQAATKYWKTKADGHRNSAIAFALGGLIYIIILVVLAECGAQSLVGFVQTALTPKGSSSPLPMYFGFGAVALIAVWILRVLIRLMLSNIHLASDCLHRRTLVLTYLALLRKNGDGSISEKDRVIVLEQVFRPAADGIVKDDAMPPTPLEALTRRFG